MVNETTGAVRERLERLLFLLRIPQRKPWGDMSAALVESKAALTSEREGVLAAVPEVQRGAAADTLAAVLAQLDRVAVAVAAQDADATTTRAAAALADVARLQVLQAPGLPYLLPAQYAARPRLTGRATAELLVERGGKDGRLLVELDGYSAPLSAGHLAQLIQAGFFDGTVLSGDVRDETLFAAPSKPLPPGISPAVPLEVKVDGEYEPRYRNPADVLAGELPVIPLSVYGAVALARANDTGGGADSSGSAMFFYRFARNSAGLGGAAFEEGTYAVVGYVTSGAEVLGQLRSGDRIRSARLVAGADRLVVPPR